jgi:hypothetical protein
MIPVEKVDRFPEECPDCGNTIDRRHSRFIMQWRYKLLYASVIPLTVGLLLLYVYLMLDVLNMDTDPNMYFLLLMPGAAMVAFAMRGRKIWEFTCTHCCATRRYLSTRQSMFKFLPGKGSVFIQRLIARRSKDKE